MKDKLEELFEMQGTLNDAIFKKHLTDDPTITTTSLLIQEGKRKELGPNSLTNEWLKKFLWALKDETRELEEELLNKWWSKDKLNMQNIRVEIVDQLHFCLSLAMTAGMDANDVFEIYLQKNKVNFDRLKNGYSKETKNEEDNKSIELKECKSCDRDKASPVCMFCGADSKSEWVPKK